MTPPPQTPPAGTEAPASSTGRSPYYLSPCPFKPISPTQARWTAHLILPHALLSLLVESCSKATVKLPETEPLLLPSHALALISTAQVAHLAAGWHHRLPVRPAPGMRTQVRKGRYVVLTAGEAVGSGAARPTFRLAGEALALAKVESAAGPELKLHFFAPAGDRPGAPRHRSSQQPDLRRDEGRFTSRGKAHAVLRILLTMLRACHQGLTRQDCTGSMVVHGAHISAHATRSQTCLACAGLLAFTPCANARGYPLLAAHRLAGDLVAAFDALACPERGGGGCLPAEVIAVRGSQWVTVPQFLGNTVLHAYVPGLKGRAMTRRIRRREYALF